jgi:hypothetical protein
LFFFTCCGCAASGSAAAAAPESKEPSVLEAPVVSSMEDTSVSSNPRFVIFIFHKFFLLLQLLLLS